MANKGPEFDTKIITPTFRLSYPHVWKSTFNQLAKREEFSIQMLFDKKTDKTALQPMVALVNKMKEWKGWSKAVGIRSPFIDGDGVNAKGSQDSGRAFNVQTRYRRSASARIGSTRTNTTKT